jgi:outer membrane immunogenic protein
MKATSNVVVRGLIGLVAGATLELAATAAVADGMYAGSRYERPFSWAGFYVGAHAGGAWSETDWTFFNGVGPEDFQNNASSFIGGGQVGLQGQWGHLVAGIEVSFSGVKLDDTVTAVLFADRSRSSTIENLLLVTGRLGYSTGPWLFYGKGGFASADVDFNTFVTSTGAPTTSSSDRENGWTVGFGTEYALTRNIIVGLEYDFVRLDIGDRNQFVFTGFISPETVSNAHADIQAVMARVSYKFGGDEPRPLK